MKTFGILLLKQVMLTALMLAVFAGASSAQDAINENELFSDPEQMTQVSAQIEIPVGEEKKTIGFSGEFTSVTADIISSTSTKDSLYSYMVGNIFLDARMKRDIKAFANLEATYLSRTKMTDVALREFFFDFNYERKVYFRTGKQVLQWGRCNLWNPTDLINVEKKTFIRKIGYREGAYGVKIHMPFGAKTNIYGFIDTGNVSSAEDAGGALKYEFMAGNTEMAFSGWAKSSYNPVLGYDISSRLWDIDIAGETSVSKGENADRLVLDRGLLNVIRRNDETATRASLALSKGYRLGNFNDRLIVTTEFYYNRSGYEENIFGDASVYPYASPVTQVSALGTPTAVSAGTKTDFMNSNNLYVPHDYSKYYGAVFASVSRFIIADMTLNLNYIRNACDGSGILSTGVAYKDPITDLSAGLLVNSFLGAENREYTFSKEKHNIQITFGVVF